MVEPAKPPPPEERSEQIDALVRDALRPDAGTVKRIVENALKQGD